MKGGQPREEKDGSELSPDVRRNVLQLIWTAIHQSMATTGAQSVPGSTLVKLLNADPSCAGLVAQAKAAFGGKGWMRKLVESEATIECVAVPGAEPHFMLPGLASSSPVAPRGKAAKKRPLQEAGAGGLQPGLLGDADAERPKGFRAAERNLSVIPADLQYLVGEVGARALKVLADATLQGQNYITGSELRMLLGPDMQAHLAAIGEAAGIKKGLIKCVLEQQPDILQAKVPGVDEPCFQLVSNAGGVLRKKPKLNQDASKGASVKGAAVKGTGSKGKGKQSKSHIAGLANVPAERPEKKVVTELPAEFAVEGDAVLYTIKAALTSMQVEDGYVAGSALSKLLRDFCPGPSEAVKNAFGGKGWIKRFVVTDPEIEAVAVPGVDEPCFRLAGSPGPQGGLKKKQNTAASAHPPKRMKQEVVVLPDHLTTDATLLVAAAQSTIASYMMENGTAGCPGSKILSALADQSDSIALIKAAFGGKGWMKQLFATQADIQSITMPGINEPCYGIAM